ncbi:MAG TPA: hypothetical protein VIX85_09385 [Acidimicrobiales bacterium]
MNDVVSEVAPDWPSRRLVVDSCIDTDFDLGFESGASTVDPIDFERIRERFLPDHGFSGKNQHYKSKYAISAAAMIHGRVYPDLLDDAAWWQTDDLWLYSFFALVIFMRAAPERTGQSVKEVALAIADRRMVRVDPIEGS